MSDEPTERDVEALTKVVDGAAPPSTRNIARAVLASDWYAERIAQACREGAAEALETAARELLGFDGIRTHGDAVRWLRDRAAALRSDA